MRKILLFFSFIATLLIVFFFGAGQALAQTPEDEAQKHGITFPIAELGNCANFSDCRNYCEDPVNRDTCIDFAKKKGFYQETSTRHEEILKSAKGELGCDSENACKAVCEQEVNHNKCFAFAKKYNLGGGQVHDPSKSEILEKAKTVLGCNSYESCRSFCENEANIQKCSEFARQTGLRGGERIEGPGGCNSPDSCRTFCSDPNNYEICSKFHSAASGQTFQGPGGCNSEDSCRAYCEKNPSVCRNIGGTSEASHAEYCNKTPNCSWTGSTCQCSSASPIQDQNVNPEEYCKQYPERCSQNFSPSEDFSTQCTRYPGCTWTGSTCQCSTTGGETSTTPIPNEPYSVQGGETIYQSECTNAGCTWTDNSCQCPDTKGVQGASTQRGFFEDLLRLILSSK